MVKTSRKRNRKFPSKLKTASTFYPRGTMSKSAKQIYEVSINPRYAPGGLGSAIRWLTYYMNRSGKKLKNRVAIEKARRMLQKKNKSGPYKKKSRMRMKKSRKRKSRKKSRQAQRSRMKRKSRRKSRKNRLK